MFLALGDDRVGHEPQGIHHHIPRHRCRPVDLEHALVGAEVFPENVDALHHLLRRPKQVGVCSGLWAGRTGVGAADARPAGVVAPGQTHAVLRQALGLRLRRGDQGRHADHRGGVAGVPRGLPGGP